MQRLKRPFKKNLKKNFPTNDGPKIRCKSPSKPNKNKILLLAGPTIVGAQFNDGKLDTPLVAL